MRLHPASRAQFDAKIALIGFSFGYSVRVFGRLGCGLAAGCELDPPAPSLRL